MNAWVQVENRARPCYFPPPGHGFGNQDIRRPEEAGLDPASIARTVRAVLDAAGEPPVVETIEPSAPQRSRTPAH